MFLFNRRTFRHSSKIFITLNRFFTMGPAKAMPADSGVGNCCQRLPNKVDLQFFIRTKKNQEALCERDLQQRLKGIAEQISRLSGVVYFTIKDFHIGGLNNSVKGCNLNLSTLSKEVLPILDDLRKLNYALELCAFVGQIDFNLEVRKFQPVRWLC